MCEGSTQRLPPRSLTASTTTRLHPRSNSVPYLYAFAVSHFAFSPRLHYRLLTLWRAAY
jgi:hypothetical protein